MQRFSSPLFVAALFCLSLSISAAETPSSSAPKKSGTKTSDPKAKTTTNKDPDPVAQSKSSDALANAALQAGSDKGDIGADYVPCKFTYGELQSLVIPERKTTFSPADAERFVQSVITETLTQQASGLLDETTAQAIVGALDNSTFVGLTPTQGLAVVMRTLAVVRNTAHVQNDLNLAQKAAQAQEDVSKSKSTIAGLLSDATSAMNQARADVDLLPSSSGLRNTVTAAQARIEELKQLAPKDTSQLTDSQNIDRLITDLKSAGNSQSYAGSSRMQIFSENSSVRPSSSTPSGGGLSSDTAISKGAVPATKIPSQNGDDATKNESVVTASAENVTAAAGLIVGRAQTSLQLLMRPVDVGCAMSVLSADETQRAYGRLVEKRYIAIQIVVRNVNQDQAFILHDAELAVNIDPGGMVGRFYSGRDKVIVRQIANAQQFFDARNVIVHTAEGIGAVMSAAALVYGGALADATNVYQSGFYQSLSKSWRDMSVDQLNLLNDTGFSSQTNAQVIVPKAGSVMFVMFVPSKQFEQAWWTLPCAARNVFSSYADREHRELIALTGKDKVAGDEQIAATGYDIERALESCKRNPGRRKHWTYNPYPFLAKHANESSDVTTLLPEPSIAKENVVSPSEKQGNSEFPWMFDPVATPYSKWNANALAIFQELSTAVVSGMHITNEPALAAQLTELKCDTDPTTGVLKFPVPDKGQLQCTISGKNLDKATSLRLRNMKDSADAKTVDGEVNIAAGDNTSGTVTFQTAALHNLTSPDYSVFLVDKNDMPTSTSAAVHLSQTRDIESLKPTDIDATSPPSTVVLSGFHLAPDAVKSLILKTASGKIELQKVTSPGPTDTLLTFDAHQITSKQWTSLGSVDGSIAVSLVTSDGSIQDVSSIPYKAPPKKAEANPPAKKTPPKTLPKGKPTSK